MSSRDSTVFVVLQYTYILAKLERADTFSFFIYIVSITTCTMEEFKSPSPAIAPVNQQVNLSGFNYSLEKGTPGNQGNGYTSFCIHVRWHLAYSKSVGVFIFRLNYHVRVDAFWAFLKNQWPYIYCASEIFLPYSACSEYKHLWIVATSPSLPCLTEAS